jgi:hypothetical protein
MFPPHENTLDLIRDLMIINTYTQVITIQRACKSINKREKELYAVLRTAGYERFKDNPLCKAFIKPKDVRTICMIFDLLIDWLID